MSAETETPSRPLVEEAFSRIRGKAYSATDIAATQLLISDSVACMFGALSTNEALPIVRWASTQAASALRNAWVLAALSNVLELDAMHLRSSVHPGTVVVPAALAVASEVGATGVDLIRAVLRGTEAAVWLGNSTGKRHRQRFQSTSTCGGFGAALACADLYGMSGSQAVNAMCNIVSTAGGLWSFVDEECGGKQWHAGHAAHCGVLCAQLARSGLTGPRHVIEGARGFHAVLCEDASARETTPSDSRWAVHDMSYKPWPSPRPTHASISAALQAREELRGREPKAVNVRTFGLAVDLCHRAEVHTQHDARFSLQYLVRAALLNGDIDLETFTAPALERIRPLMSTVSVQADEAMTAAYPGRSEALVEVVLTSGDTIVAKIGHAPGDPEQPLTNRQRSAKLGMLLQQHIDGELGSLLADFGTTTTGPVREQLRLLFAAGGIDI